MRRTRSLCFLALMLLLAGGHLSAQPTNVGREFYLSFPANWSAATPEKFVRLYIASNTRTRIQVYGGATLIKSDFTKPNDIILIDIPLSFAEAYSRIDRDPLPPDQVYANKALRITADDPVTIYGISRVTYTTDGLLALPVQALGREYIIASAPDITDHNTQKFPSQYVVTAPHDNTVLTINNTWDSYGHEAGEPFTVTLMKGDVYSVAAKGELSDLTGSIIYSSRPVSVIAGTFCSYLPDRRYGYCDYIVEMMLPVSAWGKTYHLVPFANRVKGDLIRVFSGALNTQVSINAAAPVTLPAKGGVEGRGWLQILETERRQMEFTSNNPISAAQYNNGQMYDGVSTDPFFMVLTPVEQYQTSFIFTTPSTDYPENFINLVMDSSGWKDIEIAPGGTDNWENLASRTGALPQNFPTLINGVRYAGVSFDIAPGVYRLRGRKPFAGYIYGWSSYDSYGYPMSVAVTNLVIDDPDAPTIVSKQDCLGSVEVTTTDLPNDANRRSNLSTIELDPASFNFSFDPRPQFDPSETRTTVFRLRVEDMSREAMAILVISDAVGNISRDTFYYTAFDMTLVENPTDWGSMNANVGPQSRTILLRNLASRSVTIREMVLKYGTRGFRIVDPVGEFIVGEAGSNTDTKSITVEFTPTTSGNFNDSIAVRDECGVHMMALLKANVGTPRIQIDDVDFGPWSILSPTPLARTFRIRNLSTDGGMLVVQTPVSGPNDPDFTVATGADGYPVFPLSLQAGEESKSITVYFKPTAVNVYRDEIVFPHNAGPGAGNDSIAVLNGEGTMPTGVVESGAIPGLTLGPISPTPTDDVATLEYQVPSATSVQILLVDISGRTVGTLMQKRVIAAGTHTLRFDVSALPAGSYFCRMSVGDRVLVHPVVVR